MYRQKLIYWLCYFSITIVGHATETVLADTAVLTFDTVRKLASDLSQQPYIAPPGDLPQSLQELDYDAYRAINYHHNMALWNGQNLRFRVQFFHRGYFYPDRVDINVVEDGQPTPVEFRPELFHYERGRPEDVSPGLGFSGLRILYDPNSIDRFDEVASFLGASYFRAVPLGGEYGISARGIAINTAVAGHKEEFPAFRTFWILRPQPDADSLILYALLDSLSITGAYRFEIAPGKETVILVRQSVFLRKPIQSLGLAPLTSMFLYGEDRNPGPARMDHRPEVHDSDGLLLEMGTGEWLWRPLQNPRQSLFSSFVVTGRHNGFGLLQRDRQAGNYEDPRVKPQIRPSIWVQPVGSWPQGRVELLELSSGGEGMDNIVAQYVIDRPPEATVELALEYRLRFYSQEKLLHPLARAVSTLRKTEPAGGLVYSIDFAAENIRSELSSPQVKPVVTAVGGDVTDVRLSTARNGIYRVTFHLVPTAGSKTVELRATLRRGEKAVSEIWSDQWKP